MSSWTDGYVSDIQYTAGFYHQLAPSYLVTVALLAGQRAPALDRPFTYCELGCGQGFGTNILAAANPQGSFWGVDFNPAQIANAQALATEAGLTNVTFLEESFESIAIRPPKDIPQFDFITLHGIYSWVSEVNRRAIVRFIADRLKPGGLVYVSYNCMPGWAAFGPLQRLMREHANLHPRRSDHQVEAALTFVARLRDGGARYFAAVPATSPRLNRLQGQNRQYLAHEYLNGSWFPLYHADVAREFAEAKLSYLASANLLENIDNLSLPEALRPIIAEIGDPTMTEMVRDYAVNRSFRRDVFVRGVSLISAQERVQRLHGLTIHRLAALPADEFHFRTPLGEASGAPEVYKPLAELLRRDGAVTLRDALVVEGLAAQRSNGLAQAFTLLIDAGYAHPIAPAQPAASAARLNRAVLARVAASGEYAYLAAPRIGSGISVSAVEMLALYLLDRGVKPDVAELTPAVWRLMRATGRQILREGKVIRDATEAVLPLQKELETFLSSKLKLCQALEVL